MRVLVGQAGEAGVKNTIQEYTLHDGKALFYARSYPQPPEAILHTLGSANILFGA